jgi:hypothetical protein
MAELAGQRRTAAGGPAVLFDAEARRKDPSSSAFLLPFRFVAGELTVPAQASVVQTEQPSVSEPRPPQKRLLRWAINFWLVFHVSAIIIAPSSVSPSSPLVQSLWLFFQPYLQLLYLNNGYHFFAPEPSESTLLAYKAERDDGTVIEGRIPNLQIAPRLLYHRHFMLTEQMNSGPPDLEQPWYRSYAEHIGHKYGAKKVTLTRQLHFLPTMEMVRSGISLHNPESYQSQPLGEFQCGD